MSEPAARRCGRRPYSITWLENGHSGGATVQGSIGAEVDDEPRIKQMRVEAVLLLSKTPLTTRKLAQLAVLADATEARTLVRRLNRTYESHGRALRVEQVAGGYRLMTRPALAPWLAKLGHLPPAVRLSTPMMETLAVVAYRQPVSRASAEAVRGVACGELLRQLMERDLIRVVGRSEELGRPYLYGTTKRFLQLFGLPSADALPPIQWRTLQDDADQSNEDPEITSLDSPTDELSTSPKESDVSTVVAPLLSGVDP
ncbi:MAG: SMC-Scp complex subunit ScpB, partial [Pirellulales bacterium]|nr:SMC-Scp complex subunit ScpB [Pirellulales bacterium]